MTELTLAECTRLNAKLQSESESIETLRDILKLVKTSPSNKDLLEHLAASKLSRVSGGVSSTAVIVEVVTLVY